MHLFIMALSYTKKSASCMYVLRNLGEALAVRPHDEIWGIQGPYLSDPCNCTAGQGNPTHDRVLMPTTAVPVNYA
jgi:hypothetical protein